MTLKSTQVHCRTGSLEDTLFLLCAYHLVHCRTGSLEVCVVFILFPYAVHCRTGSLEDSGINAIVVK